MAFFVDANISHICYNLHLSFLHVLSVCTRLLRSKTDIIISGTSLHILLSLACSVGLIGATRFRLVALCAKACE